MSPATVTLASETGSAATRHASSALLARFRSGARPLRMSGSKDDLAQYEQPKVEGLTSADEVIAVHGQGDPLTYPPSQ
jgi:hypothetical protein